MGEASKNAAGAKPAISIAALAKRYGKLPVLEGIELAVQAGEAFALVGANGAGKTTVIRCVLDLCAYQSGRIEIFGVRSGTPAARRPLAYVPERFLPPHYLRCGEFLRLMLQLCGKAYDANRAGALLEELQLEREVLARPVRQLSKGMTQKLGLAWCFLAERDLYVLDEPMSGLDPASRAAVKSVLRRLSAEGRTIFFTSHVLSDVEELCSSMAVLHAGKVLFRGAPRQLCERHAEPRLEGAFMKCIRSS
jgi:ABC-2 type transport system ATP-binding protein